MSLNLGLFLALPMGDVVGDTPPTPPPPSVLLERGQGFVRLESGAGIVELE